jgi:hypothetical protein
MLLKMAAIFLLLIFFPNSAGASNVNFSQSILPAKIVYLDSSLKIKNIWSNVSTKNGVYVIKFFDLVKNVELSMNRYLLDSYQQFETENLAFNYSGANENMNATVDFIQKNNNLEEIRTFV